MPIWGKLDAVWKMLLNREKNEEIPFVWIKSLPFDTKWFETRRIEMI
jgi:hypothetical protein